MTGGCSSGSKLNVLKMDRAILTLDTWVISRDANQVTKSGKALSFNPTIGLRENMIRCTGSP